MKQDILGYGVQVLPVVPCVEQIFTTLRGQLCDTRPRFSWLACLNPHSYAVALDDRLFAEALRDADWLLPDGAGVVLASRLLGGRVTERVTGSDVFFGLNMHMNAARGMRVFFLGATPETLALIGARMAKDYPHITVVGTYSPPFKAAFSSAENEEMLKAINDAAPEVLWVGMTAPKQEKWILENRARLNVRFAAAIGAVFDFYAGNVKRSNPVFQRFGLEWLPRLLQQPGRLWRRTFVSAPIFLWHVFQQRLGSGRRRI
ncbi:MAG: WecB/TagA/CpsF family glycosyltransferase [Candidatus Accumulibacter sp. UW20]|jgi:N-acetylglucosaminyldiphosphoundecaprenol N-acetyl-beta-D-mannosaminyltransferase